MIKELINFGIILIFLFTGPLVLAHAGHGSSPTASSTTKFGSAAESESPLSLNFKLRSGYEFGQYVGALPSLSSNLGNDEMSLNLSYEFQIRQFNSDQKSEYEDRDYNNHFTARAKKSISESLGFTLTGEYEKSEATRIARMINDYNYTTINSNLSYSFQKNWAMAFNYLYSVRQYPNGTYLIPSPSSNGIGEPIVPGQTAVANPAITVQGTTDNLNEISIATSGEIGEQTLIAEAKYVLNDSDASSRKYNGQAFKLGFEKMLWSRIFTQISYSTESRNFSEREDKVDIAEIGLQKELSARMSVLGLIRNNQIVSATSTSFWEGYAQIQYGF